MSGLERINPQELARPAGFAHAVLAHTDRIVFLAGQTALDAEGRIVGDGVVAQFEQALGNLLTALRAAGGEPGGWEDGARVRLLDEGGALIAVAVFDAAAGLLRPRVTLSA